MRRGLLAGLLSCAIGVSVIQQRADAQAAAVVTILHINDIYEIDGMEGGRFGGLSRTATVLRELERRQSPVLMTLGGDYLSPSAIGTAIVDGQPLAGRQMVDVLNHVGLDWAVLGNHEFDVSEASFAQRMSESRFRILASNVSNIKGEPFPGTVRSAVVPIRVRGRNIRLGLIGLTIDANRRPWVRYSPPIEAARAEIATMKGKVDAIVALTHLPLADDQELVSAVPDIDVVLGGHEHENWLLQRGPGFTPIVKADANVRTVAIVTLNFTGTGVRPFVSSHLRILDERIRQDGAIQGIVRKWVGIAYDAFSTFGFEPARTVVTLNEPLDGRETTVRNQSGRLTDLITAALDREAGGVDVAIMNGGSVRIDDILQPGPVTEYDVIRVLPFGGTVTRAAIDGRLLAAILDTGVKNRGSGGFLHARGAVREGEQWRVQGEPLDPERRYRVALTDFLLSGGETNLGFLTRTNPSVHDVQDLRDVRMALMTELQRQYGSK